MTTPGRIITGIKYNVEPKPWRGDTGFFFPPEQSIFDRDGSCVLSHKRLNGLVEITLARSDGSIILRHLVVESIFSEEHFGLIEKPLPASTNGEAS